MITVDQKITCLERELKMRRRVYPDWVARERMSQAMADRELAVMEAILADYRSQLPTEPDLFGEGRAAK